MTSDGEPFSELVIPALNDFSLLSVQVSQLPDQKVTLTFSSPILERQSLIGFFQIDGEDIEDVLWTEAPWFVDLRNHSMAKWNFASLRSY